MTRSFLPTRELRPAELARAEGLTPRGLMLGAGAQALEVIVYDASRRPTQESVRKLWKERWASRPTPVVLVVLYADKAGLCGHTEHAHEAPPVNLDLDPHHVERLCEIALELPDHHAVDRFLREQIPETESPIFGIRNQGLLATYVIQRGSAEISEELWRHAHQQATKVRGKHKQRLLNALGYSVQSLPGPAEILLAKGTRTALAIYLDQNETAEIASQRFGNQIPIAYALNLAQHERLDWVIVARGAELRLYPATTGVGVGRRGMTDTYLQVNLDLLSDDRLPLLWLAFSAEALGPGELLKRELIERSNRYAADIGVRLRDRIYTLVIPQLAKAIVDARDLKKPTTADLELAYQMTLHVLFRLLFVAYAEDHDLLPYKTNERYRSRSLTQHTRELKALRENGGGFDPGTSRWDEVNGLWKAVREGNTEWGVPAYDGGLFEDDRATHPVGAALAQIKLSNREFGLILSNLLLDDKTPEGLGPVDFRSLGVREFGTIYEGLLENELSVAETHLTTDQKGNYKPIDDHAKAKVGKGEIYLHTRSGARKASGSYYTKQFAVDHLLDHSLEPALDEHLARVEKLVRSDGDKAAAKLFEFYVADIAMGSGHFLISAIDRIERRFLSFLTDHSLPGVDAEVDKLRVAAREKLGDALDERWLEKNKLLRRLIARRCVYGVDLNPLAVELARLSVWIHTFVPGLPLSFLDHNLVCGNSLVGIATFDEAIEEVTSRGDNLDLFDDPARRLLGVAVDAVCELRALSDADLADVDKAKAAQAEIEKKLSGTRALFDILTAARFDAKVEQGMGSGAGGMATHFADPRPLALGALHQEALKAMAAIPPFHFPIAFPEVFLRENPGFDVIIGNPPWEKAHVEENEFWARYFPGFRGLKQSDQEILRGVYRRDRPDLVVALESEASKADLLRSVLMTGPYPGMGTGHPDLYKAFCWRFWHLICKRAGRVGVVLPRSAWSAKGSEEFRKRVFQDGRVENLTNLLNSAGWVFDDAEPRYTITLSAFQKEPGESAAQEVLVRGPYRSMESFTAGVKLPPVSFAVRDVLSWTDSASLPLLLSEESAKVFLQLRKSPRLDADLGGWRCRPLQGDLNSTTDKPLMAVIQHAPKGYWPVYKGESFDIWIPDTGADHYYAWVEPGRICKHLQEKREHGHRIARSAFAAFSAAWLKSPTTLPCRNPRIAYRRVTNRTNRRTVIVSLVPPNVVLTDKAAFLLWPVGDSRDVAYLLGIMSSLPLDWYARAVVELQVDFHVLNPFPIPRPMRTHPLWQRAVALSGRLTCSDKRFAEWAKTVGVKCGPIPEDEKNDMICELDAVVAHLYGLTEKQLAHIFETFHEGWDYENRMQATLKHFHEWKKKA